VWRKPLLAATAVALLAVAAPVAHASPVRAGCSFESVAQQTVTGSPEAYVAALYGIAVFDDNGSHTLRCYVTVNGVEVASTNLERGVSVVVAAGTRSYDAASDAGVEICTEVDGVTTSCAVSAPTQIPPQEVVDVVDDVFEIVTDLLTTCDGCNGPLLETVLCPVLQSLAPGLPGVVDVKPDGDVALAVVGPLFDCAPYDPPA
jgi:hypothetical protein